MGWQGHDSSPTPSPCTHPAVPLELWDSGLLSHLGSGSRGSGGCPGAVWEGGTIQGSARTWAFHPISDTGKASSSIFLMKLNPAPMA